MMQTNMNASEFLRLVDHSAGMNDRWLFLAAFCLLLLLCAVVIYWLVKQLQAVIADYKGELQAHHESLARILAAQNDTTLKLALCLDRNTEALKDCSEELRRFKERNG